MSALAGLVPKLAVFVVATVLGGSATFVVTGIAGAKGPVSTAGVAPNYLLTADTPGNAPIAFDLVDAPEPPGLVPGLPPADLSLAASSLLGGKPVVPKVKPLGFPRIDPISQFDGGPFAGANCTLASGAMLARLGFGIVTTGSILRTLQDDQEGGTGLDDLQVALWRGYGVSIHTGLLTPQQLKSLLDAGYGAVIQGIYGRIPLPIRLQASFEGPHAIYLDGHYRGGHGTPEAYYVIDPLGRPFSTYQGAWWPASIVDDFGTAFGGGRIPAAWVFPPGGVPPEVVGPDVLPIPPSPHGGPGPSPSPGESPSRAPSASAPSGPVEPGDIVVTPVVDPSVLADSTLGGFDLNPYLLYCLTSPIPPSCPTGIEGIFDIPLVILPAPPPGPAINVRFVDSDQPGRALIGFTLDPPGAPADVRFWEADGSPAFTHGATTMSTLTLLGQTMLIARLDVLASTAYHFQVVAGDGSSATATPVGTFTTGSGLVHFGVSLATTSSPSFHVGTGLSPYLHLDPGGDAPPLIRFGGGTAPAGCTGTAEYGGVGYCLGLTDPVSIGPCTRAQVSYELAGVGGSGVVVRAFPTEDGVLPDGSDTLAGVLEADGPLTSGNVAVGCLADGLSYAVLLDVVGDDQGPIAGEVITLP